MTLRVKRIRKSLLASFIVFTMGFLFAQVPCTAADSAGRVTSKAPGAGNKAADTSISDIQERIARAIEEAKRTGKTSVDIYLDEEPETVQSGDLVTVNCLSAMDGEALNGAGPSKLVIVAGQPGPVPGLHKAVLGMRLHQRAVKEVPPDEAFRQYSQRKIKRFSSVKTLPIEVSLSQNKIKSQLGKMPSQGEIIRINPYFDSRVKLVKENQVVVEHLPENGRVETAPFGKTTVTVDRKSITIRLEPVTGARFTAGGDTGRIRSVSDTTFTVDFNHPLAGRSFTLDFEVLSIVKSSALANKQIPWIEDHDAGRLMAAKQGKNQVLFLYADWCQWCEKMLRQTFEDPRIKALAEEFIWTKVNSDKDRNLKDFYHQEGFPLVVVLDSRGNVLKKIDGYRDAGQLRPELEEMMNATIAKAEN